MNRTRYIAQAGLIAALYGGTTVIVNQVMQFLSWGPIQFRVSEALTVFAFFTPAAIPGLALGTLIANLLNMSQTGPLGWLDVVFGTLATLLGAVWTWRFRKSDKLGLLGPVLTNALIVPAYLPIMLKAAGVPLAEVYTIPGTSISMDSSWLAMYLVGVVAVAIGQAVVMYGLGWGVLAALRSQGIGEANERRA